jgi:tRNA-specific 2-thiouridylase
VRVPRGGRAKTEGRVKAPAQGLPVADTRDSLDICFVPAGRSVRVVEKLRPDAGREGDIVHIDGRVLGRHKGVINYTIGQRRGLGLATGEPLFVVAIDAARHRILVGPREALAQHRIVLRDLNWIGGGDPADLDGLEVFARVRSSRPPRPGVFEWQGGGAAISLNAAEEGVAPGQACVLYDSDRPRARVLGGGFIARDERSTAVPAATSSPAEAFA